MRIAIMLIGAFSLTSYTFWAANNVFYGSSICLDCGKCRHERTWYLPMTGVTIWSSQSEAGNSLSDFLTDQKLCGSHTHRWTFCTGSGAGVRCALGNGRMLEAVTVSGSFRDYLDAEWKWGDKGRALRVLDMMRDEVLQREFFRVSTFLRQPFDKKQFDDWIEVIGPELESRMQELRALKASDEAGGG